jgi:hypothetical protein
VSRPANPRSISQQTKKRMKSRSQSDATKVHNGSSHNPASTPATTHHTSIRILSSFARSDPVLRALHPLLSDNSHPGYRPRRVRMIVYTWKGYTNACSHSCRHTQLIIARLRYSPTDAVRCRQIKLERLSLKWVASGTSEFQ